MGLLLRALGRFLRFFLSLAIALVWCMLSHWAICCCLAVKTSWGFTCMILFVSSWSQVDGYDLSLLVITSINYWGAPSAQPVLFWSAPFYVHLWFVCRIFTLYYYITSAHAGYVQFLGFSPCLICNFVLILSFCNGSPVSTLLSTPLLKFVLLLLIPSWFFHIFYLCRCHPFIFSSNWSKCLVLGLSYILILLDCKINAFFLRKPCKWLMLEIWRD